MNVVEGSCLLLMCDNCDAAFSIYIYYHILAMIIHKAPVTILKQLTRGY